VLEIRPIQPTAALDAKLLLGNSADSYVVCYDSLADVTTFLLGPLCAPFS